MHWEEICPHMGGVWFRGSRQTFVAVTPEGKVLGVNYRSRASAYLALLSEYRRGRKFARAVLDRSGGLVGFLASLRPQPVN